MVLPYEPIESDSVINVANPPATNPDLAVAQMPVYERIVVTNLVGPTHANKQHKSAEKRTVSLLAAVQRMAVILADVDNEYLRRDGTTPKTGAAGLNVNMALNGFRFTGLAVGTQTGNIGVYDHWVLKAPPASPALTGIPRAPTAAPGTATTQLATTEFVQNGVDFIDSISDELVLSGIGSASASGNFTVPAGVYLLRSVAVGGGGGGGSNADGDGNNAVSAGGGGGAHGGIRSRSIPVTPGQVIAWSTGAGGGGGPASGGANGNAGASGGSTTFLSIVAPGGGGGGGGVKSSSGGVAGTPGASDSSVTLPFAASPGIYSGSGGNGGGGFYRSITDASAVHVTIGVGGGGSGANAAPGGVSNPATPGGLGSGGGGRGAADVSQAGAAGGAGFIYLRWGQS